MITQHRIVMRANCSLWPSDDHVCVECVEQYLTVDTHGVLRRVVVWGSPSRDGARKRDGSRRNLLITHEESSQSTHNSQPGLINTRTHARAYSVACTHHHRISLHLSTWCEQYLAKHAPCRIGGTMSNLTMYFGEKTAFKNCPVVFKATAKWI